MSNFSSKKTYYEKTVNLILSIYDDIRGMSFWKADKINDRKHRILVKEFGSPYVRENLLFTDKFLVFPPLYLATTDFIYYHGFEGYSVSDKLVYFSNIKEIRYSLMPCQTQIKIVTQDGSEKLILDNVPHIETYSDLKAYERSVNSGSYKTSTVCFLATLYALTALYRYKGNAYENMYQEIKANIALLIHYLEENDTAEIRYGKFFSFDFVTCVFDSQTVDRALEKIDSVKEEIHETEIEERREQFARTLDRKMEEARKEYDKRNN